MAQWYVKELSNITKVSVQTLHHYDRIGLLKPSLRLDNGYRLYSETDLLRLQQIIALKFFGFDLARIKYLISHENDMLVHLISQAQYLKDEANMLLAASKTLTSIIDDCHRTKSIPWQCIIESIEVYRMTEKIDNNWLWLAKSLSADELKEYAEFEHELKMKRTPEDKEKFTKSWEDIVKDIYANISNEPNSETGINIAKRCSERVDALYFHKYHRLRKSVWEKGFKGESADLKHGLTPEAIQWLDKAYAAYYGKRIAAILSKIPTHTDNEVKAEWDKFLEEKCGKDEMMKKEFVSYVINNDRCVESTKQWLRKHY